MIWCGFRANVKSFSRPSLVLDLPKPSLARGQSVRAAVENMKDHLLSLALILLTRLAFGQIPAPTDAPKPLTPEQAVASYRLPPGFRLEVIASEPLIASPSGV